MTVSDVLSILALIVSGFTLMQMRRSVQLQSRLTEREVELVRIQLQQANAHLSSEKQAAVSARLFKLSRYDWKLRVFNMGPAEARNIELILDDQNSIVVSNLVDGKFPMSKLENGQSVDIPTIVTMDTPSKEWLAISWDDNSGQNRNNRVEITL